MFLVVVLKIKLDLFYKGLYAKSACFEIEFTLSFVKIFFFAAVLLLNIELLFSFVEKYFVAKSCF